MAILFCNISWMKRYAGRDTDDPPLGGGEFPRTQGFCGEECNFVPGDDGYVYGHFETIKNQIDREVRIERLGAGASDRFIDGVDIVWTAPKEGKDPRTVVGWYRDARLYRTRERFEGRYPSARHRKDEIESYMVKVRAENAFLLPPERRILNLQRGKKGWSGMASWWYAEQSINDEARSFVRKVAKFIDGQPASPVLTRRNDRQPGQSHASGAATSEAYQRYVREYEVTVHPQHDKLHKAFVAFLRKRHSQVEFPACFRDDLRFAIKGEAEVMVEVKPADAATVRYALRAAIGQLLDYRQHQRWKGRQMILVGAEIVASDDLSLAFDNGFGVAWPVDKKGFEIRWPTSK